ncbi:MAG: zinc ribbon domain-containing protein [Propionibacteriaceae bacterium]|jgi:DNA-directed RNA polymerase subunit RPC12/RpoP|nr:zinc ribbon domain-containing protein [Propionibacteriaceae bacterium]
MALQEYKCPNCGAAISFDANTQTMLCPYCDTSIDVAALAATDAGLEQEQTSEAVDLQYSTEAWSEEEQQSLRMYVCSSCGGEIVTDATVGATTCPFCDNPVVVMSQFSGVARPELVIPFKVDKEGAVAALRQHYQGKRLLPKVFKDENHLDEVKGVYVPFWLFDTTLDARMAYRTTSVSAWSDSEYDYIETSYYDVEREGQMTFQMVPADGSSKMPDTLMESIEPYDYSAIEPFQTAYLSGYMANRYDVEPAAVSRRADQRVAISLKEAFDDTVTGYATVQRRRQQVATVERAVHYGLLPVWLLNTSWNGQRYVFAMNGQTGKMVGDLPLDTRAFWLWVIGLFVGIGGVIALIVFLMWMFA